MLYYSKLRVDVNRIQGFHSIQWILVVPELESTG
jgi:hypothetical protein